MNYLYMHMPISCPTISVYQLYMCVCAYVTVHLFFLLALSFKQLIVLTVHIQAVKTLYPYYSDAIHKLPNSAVNCTLLLAEKYSQLAMPCRKCQQHKIYCCLQTITKSIEKISMCNLTRHIKLKQLYSQVQTKWEAQSFKSMTVYVLEQLIAISLATVQLASQLYSPFTRANLNLYVCSIYSRIQLLVRPEPNMVTLFLRITGCCF